MFAISSMEEFFHYVYYQVVNVTLTMLTEINGYSSALFGNSYVSAIVKFFSLLGWGLGLIGAFMAMMEFAVTYQNGGGGSFLGTGMNMLKLFLALLFSFNIPILLYTFCTDIYGSISHAAAGTMTGADTGIVDLAKSAITSMFQRLYPGAGLGIKPPTIWDFWKQLSDGFQMSDIQGAMLSANADWWALLQLVALVYVIFKVFMGNLKRGGILLVQMCVCSLHMFSLARGYADGYSSWCKQVVGLCFTAFMQNLLYLLGLLLLQDSGSQSLVFALGLLLVSAEVPRIAQWFGMETSTRSGIGQAMHSAGSAIMLIRAFA